jgi:hypothetical protein
MIQLAATTATTTHGTETRIISQTKIDGIHYNNNNYSSPFDRKIGLITEGLQPRFSKVLSRMLKENSLAIVDFIINMNTEINPSNSHKRNIIEALSALSNFHNDKKLFKEMTRENVLSFLDSYRKSENSDPQHKWIGTYNFYRALIIKFFKWLYHSDLEPCKRPKPSVVENIPELKRKEQSIYKPTDLWTAEDDLLFLKYCPSKRMKCYHMVSRDLSCRPHELLKLRIKEIFFKTTPDNDYQYAEVQVNGKTGSRPLPLIDSIPYLKDYLDNEHPQPGNPNVPLICGVGRSLGRCLTSRSLSKIYNNYKKELFPKLLDSPDILPEDKQKIRELLKKPWNPYIRRHSALTEKSTILKEHVLRQHAGWTIGSQMPQKYLHYFGNESSESLLEAYGIISKSQKIDQLKPKQCPNCNEPNKPDSKFCAKCRLVLSYNAYAETLKNQKQKEDRLNVIENQMKALLTALGNIKDQSQVNQMAQTLYSSGILNTTQKK